MLTVIVAVRGDELVFGATVYATLPPVPPVAVKVTNGALLTAAHKQGDAVKFPTPLPPVAAKVTCAGEMVKPLHGDAAWVRVRVAATTPLAFKMLIVPVRDAPVFVAKL